MRRRARAGETEEDADAPRAGYRDRIVVAVVVGLILILGGAYAAVSRGILWSLPIFALGFGLVLTLISFNRRYRHASPSLRRTIDFSSAFLNAGLLAGILIVVNVIAFRYGGQPLDLTREQTYSLSSMTINQLVSLKQPVTFTMVFGQGPRAVRQRERVVQLLESYKAVNPGRIELASVDPYAELTRGEELFKRVPELGILHGGGVVIEYGEGENAAARRGAQPGPVSAAAPRCGTRRPGPVRVGLHGRGRDYIGIDPLERGEEGEGRIHGGPRRAAHQRFESGRSRSWQLEGPALEGGLRGDRPQLD